MTHLHNFTLGTPQNRKQVPLTMEEIARRAPSALATRPPGTGSRSTRRTGACSLTILPTI
jgi:hypothetical protein